MLNVKCIINLILFLAYPLIAMAVPVVIELNEGEIVHVTFSSGKSAQIKLISLFEETEPFYQEQDSQFIDAVVRAHVSIEVNGIQKTIQGGPYHLPAEVNGVAVLISCTKGWTGGIFTDRLKKDIRLEVEDAEIPWSAPGHFVYPILNYRWRASNYQHTYLGIVVNQRSIYYHRGEDMGMIPDLEKTLAMTDGVLTRVPPPGGDKSANTIIIRDKENRYFRYVHLNEENIEPSLYQGYEIKQGEVLGLTGNTYNGRRVPSPHLHLSVGNDSGDYLNTYPLFVSAYQHSYPDDILPLAGNVRHVYEGEEIILDGSFSMTAKGSNIEKYKWTFTDGGTAFTPQVKRTYNKPGVYSEELLVTDNQGRSDRDFVEVNVLSLNQKIRMPRVWINYYPVREITPDTNVKFLIRWVNLKDLTIDYGDGVKHPYSEWSTYKYPEPGNYIVTVEGKSTGAGDGIFKVRVIVRE